MALLFAACGGSGDQLPLLPPDSSLSYNPPPAFTVTIPISPIVPTKNVNLTNFTIIPNLPAGLVIDPATGVISGTPTQVAATATYTVSVPDGASAITATLVITVNPLPSKINNPRAASSIAPTNSGGADGFDLDIDLNGICSPTRPCTSEGALAGRAVVILRRTGWNTYSSVDGALIAHLDIAPGFATAWDLSTDASYLLFAGAEGVQAITPQGMTPFAILDNAGRILAVSPIPEMHDFQTLDSRQRTDSRRAGLSYVVMLDSGLAVGGHVVIVRALSGAPGSADAPLQTTK